MDNVSGIWAGKKVTRDGLREHMFSVRTGNSVIVHRFESKEKAEAARAVLVHSPRVTTDEQDSALADIFAEFGFGAAKVELDEHGVLQVVADEGQKFSIEADGDWAVWR